MATARPGRGRQSWPDGAVKHVRELKASQRQLSAMLFICMEKGIKEQNYGVIDDLSDLIIDDAAYIQKQARAIMDCLDPDRGPGRLPTWYIVAEECEAQAGDIIEYIRRIPNFAQRAKWLPVQGALEVAQQASGRIIDEVLSIPLDSDAYKIPDWVLEGSSAGSEPESTDWDSRSLEEKSRLRNRLRGNSEPD
jgi:hypothetical protein